MNLISRIGCLTVGLSAIILSGCRDSSASITATRLDATSAAPQRLLVFADVGYVLKDKIDGDEEPVLSTQFVDALGKCGVISSYLKKTPVNDQLTLDDSAKLRDDRGLSASRFDADAVLDIQWIRQTKATNAPFTAVYDLNLFDSKTKKPLWKGQMNFVSAWYGGQRFAATLVDRLKQDGLIPATCVPPAVPKA